MVRNNWHSAHPLTGHVFHEGQLSEPDKTIKSSCGEITMSGISSFAFELRAEKISTLVLLGEVHDNPEHHWFRSKILPLIAAPVVLEQMSKDQQVAIEKFMKVSRRTRAVDDFKLSTGWLNSGWQKYPFDVLLQSILELGQPIYAGDVPRDAIMKVAKEGEGALPAGERKRLGLDQPLGQKLDNASLAEIEEAHCGAMPKEAFGGMAYAQRYRDASLADALLKAADKHGSAILIAGNGHVRTDRGVPWYVRQRAPGKKVVSVMLIEVEDGKNDPEAYVPRDPDGKPATDYIIFTPRADRADPCEMMKAKTAK